MASMAPIQSSCQSTPRRDGSVFSDLTAGSRSRCCRRRTHLLRFAQSLCVAHQTSNPQTALSSEAGQNATQDLQAKLIAFLKHWRYDQYAIVAELGTCIAFK